LPRPLDLSGLPRSPRRRSWIAIAASVAAHALLVLFFTVEGRLPELPRRSPQLIVLAPLAKGPETVEMRYHPGRLRAGQSGRDAGPGVGRRELRPPRRAVPPPDVVQQAPTPEPPAPDTGSAAPAPRRPVLIGRIGPELADGRLWVRPLPLPPKELASRLSRKRHVELVDSAVNAIVQSYLDSIASDPAAKRVGLPSWTTQVAGKKFGLDSSNIYVAGLKIPAAVLALLPIPAGNIDQNQAYNHLMAMRADLQYAAQRSQNLEEFKQMIRDIRLRKEREREFERNQRTAPPPEEPATP
jgi:hypothetical protein